MSLVTKADIVGLMVEAEQAGDDKLADICTAALNGSSALAWVTAENIILEFRSGNPGSGKAKRTRKPKVAAAGQSKQHLTDGLSKQKRARQTEAEALASDREKATEMCRLACRWLAGHYWRFAGPGAMVTSRGALVR